MSEALLQQIVGQLQAVTQRLETLEKRMAATVLTSIRTGTSPAGGASAPATPTGSGSVPAKPATPTPAAAATPAPAAAAAASAASSADTHPSVVAYDELIAKTSELEKLATEIGGDVAELTRGFISGFKMVRDFVVLATRAKEPSDSEKQELFRALGELVGGFENKVKRGPDFNLLNAAKEAGQALFWVAVKPTPTAQVKEGLDQFLFWGNKARTEYKQKDPKRVQWVQSFQELLEATVPYVKTHHTAGLYWNPRGVSLAEARAATPAAAAAAPAAAAPAARRGGAPPPPPAPTAEELSVKDVHAPAAGGAEALFREIQAKSEGITAGLRHVTKDMKTKNQKPGDAPPPPVPASKAPEPRADKADVPRGPPEITMDGYKVFVRNYVDVPELVIPDMTIKHAVMISNCLRSVIQIQGKVNSVTLERCDRTGVVCQKVIGSIGIVNCERPQVQVTESVPTVTVDSSSGLSLFLPEATAAETDILACKSAEMNLSIVKGQGDDVDVDEYPLPDQFVTKWKAGRLSTVPNKHV